MPETPVDLAAACQRIERAHTEIGEVCAEGPSRRFRMHIPSDPDRDTDLIVTAALNDAELLAGEVEQLRAAVARVRRLCELTINASVRVQAIHQAHDTLAALDGPAADEADESTRTLDFLDHIGEDAMHRFMVDARRALGEGATFDHVAVEAARRARAAEQTGGGDD